MATDDPKKILNDISLVAQTLCNYGEEINTLIEELSRKVGGDPEKSHLVEQIRKIHLDAWQGAAIIDYYVNLIA